MMFTNQETVNDRVVDFFRRRPELVVEIARPVWLRSLPPLSPEQYAAMLLADAEFRSLQLGTWLGTTNGEVFSEAVSQVIPPFYKEEFDLMVDGLVLASHLQAQEGKQAAGRVALGTVITALVFVGFTYMAREAA